MMEGEGQDGVVNFHTPKEEGRKKTYEARDMFWRSQGEDHIPHDSAPHLVVDCIE